MASFSARREDLAHTHVRARACAGGGEELARARAFTQERIIFKKIVQNFFSLLPFRFCKIGPRHILFIFGRKNGRLLFVCFALFVATLSDFGLLFLTEALIQLRKMLIIYKEKNI